MPDPVTKEASVGKAEKDTEATSHGKTETTIKKINVSVLEMEDVLFHHNSAIMMPESPIEEPDEDKGSERQEKVTGAKAMALIFKQYDFDPDKQLLIAGHTDTSGEDKYNFGLSELRAQNVQYILTGERDLWARNAYSKQKIEDYQQFLNYVNKIHKYPCHSGKVDDKWGDITKGATENFIKYFNGEFITKYGKEFTGPMALIPIPGNNLELVKKDGKKRWTEDLWRAAYNFYFLAISSALEIKPAALYKKTQTALRWVNDKKKYVACGESFPIDEAKKDSYRSQDNRRVEILIFDRNDAPVIKCPVTDKGEPKWDTKHKPEECPLWHNLILRPLYLSPKDMNSLSYHMTFTYWDRVKNKLMQVPEGLAIEVYQDGKKVESICRFNSSDKIYSVRVRFTKPIKELSGIKLHFEFKAKDKWIYTKDKDSDPVMFPVKADDLTNLQKKDAYKEVVNASDIAKLNISERIFFYDLPEYWSSKKYWTRYKNSGGNKKANWYSKVFHDGDKLDLKPVGSKLSKPDNPMTFSLDDFVLTNNQFKPINLAPADQNKKIAVLKSDFSIHKDDGGGNFSYYTKNAKAAIHFPAPEDVNLGGVLQNFRLYAIFSDRIATGETFAGHRAAVYRHKENCIKIRRFQQIHKRCTFWSGQTRPSANWWAIGKYDSYFLKNINANIKDNEKQSYIFNYFRWFFRKKTGVTLVGNAWQKWKSDTAKNIIDVWNDHEGADPILPSLFHDNAGDKNRIFIRYHLHPVENSGEKEALIHVWPSTHGGRSNMGQDAGNVRENDNKRYNGPVNRRKDSFVIAHEFGHATSIDDDYLEVADNCSYYMPGFIDFKPGSPFELDKKSMMVSNKYIRPRQYWHFAEWMHREFDSAGAKDFALQMKGKNEYKIPYNSGNQWRSTNMSVESKSHYNYPTKFLFNARNLHDPTNPKGRFNVYLYPLGKDDYSQKEMYSGKKFTAVMSLVVNLYFRAWHDPHKPKHAGKGKDECGFKNIQDSLVKIIRGTYQAFLWNNGIEINGDPPFEHTFVQVQPRVLVRTYTTPYLDDYNSKSKWQDHVDEIMQMPEFQPHCTIDVRRSSSTTSIDLTTNPTELKLKKSNADFNDFWEYFSQLLGLTKGSFLRANNFSIGDFIKKAGSNATYSNL
ncbi:MAG: hypothetical protein GY841_21540 [FCB group bacterium]|nr:hypothetical protein [FCB group bacterium]